MTKRTIVSARNPVWANFSKTLIDIEVNFSEIEEEYVPFTCDPNDQEPHGSDIYNRAISGEFGEIAEFIPPSNITGDDAMEFLRLERDSLLNSTDYIEMPTKWATLSEEQQTAWATYRQALRDLPANSPNAELHWNEDYTARSWVNVDWPVQP